MIQLMPHFHSVHLRVYTDGSFDSLPNEGSQGGELVFLCDKDSQCNPLSWSSSNLQQVVRSALAAETMSMCDGFDLSLFLAKSIDKIFQPTFNPQPLTILGITDNQSLYEVLGTSTQIQDK